MTNADKMEKAGRAIDDAIIAFNAAVVRTNKEVHGLKLHSPDRLTASISFEDGQTITVEIPVGYL